MSIGGNSGGQLRSIIERAERLLEDKKAVEADLKELFSEAKGNGFTVKILKRIIKYRAEDPAMRDEEDAIFDLYLSALGAALAPKRSKPQDQAEEAAPPKAKPTDDTPDEAEEKGRVAAQHGKPVTANPYPAFSEQRARWDLGWRKESGSDGMDPDPSWKPDAPPEGDQ